MHTKTLYAIMALALLGVTIRNDAVAQAVTGQHTVMAPAHQFRSLGVVLPHVLVTAMAFQPNGVIYAGGRYLIPVNDPHATPPVLVAGSVWAVSHDHGAHWATQISSTAQTSPNTQLWRRSTVWPDSFTANSIAVDPINPRIIYVAGCMSDQTCAGSFGGHYVLRSVDGGRTWHDALLFSRVPASHGNVVVTPLLQQILRRGGTQLTQAYDVVVDPHNDKRVYACVSGLGMLRSDDGARSWRYAAQPLWLNGRCELLIDPLNSKVFYSLDRQNKVLYRTTDSGASWTVRSAFAEYNQDILVLSGLTPLGRALYMNGLNGLYASIDGGAHWRLVIKPPMIGGMGPSIRGNGGWITAFLPRSNTQPEGLYATQDGSPWRLAVNTDLYGLRYYGALDFTAYTNGSTRLWEDHGARVVYTAAQTGGLYRWSGGL